MNFLNTFRYLHLFIGLAALITGLIFTLPLFSQNVSNDYIGMLALFTGLLNLQQFTGRQRADTPARRAINILVAVALMLTAVLPLLAIWLIPTLVAFGVYAAGLAVGAVCLTTVMALVSQLQQLSFSLPGRKSDREAGTVKWFNTNKGFGFISRDQGDDVFVHFRAIRGEGHRALEEGQRVEFVVARREKGLQAEDVVIL
ncbi:MAG: CspA family cold shock protein [Halopseudomonas sp.]